MSGDIVEVKKLLADRAQEVAEFLLPKGHCEGAEWRVGSINGEPGQSLAVHLTGTKAGVWGEFNGGEGGDLLDLWCAVKGVSLPDALDQAREWLELPQTASPSIAPDDEEPRKYVQPDEPFCHPPRERVLTYLMQERKIPAEVISRYQIGETDRGQIVFPYRKPGSTLAMYKLRDAKDGAKPKPVVSGCEPILFGWQAIPADAREIILTEGEIDTLSWDAYGHPALSVPFGGGGGAKQQWIENEFERLDRFERIYLSTDMDECGEKAAEEIANRLGRHRCLRVKLPRKDANDCRKAGVPAEEMERCLAEAEPISVADCKGLRIINPADWYEKPVPPREFIVDGMIPASTVTLLYGDGGLGKSQLVMQLGGARAIGRDWIGTLPKPGRTLLLSAEDDEPEMHRRLDAIRTHYGVSFTNMSDLRLVDLVGENAILGTPARNGVIEPTALFHWLVDQIAWFRSDLCVIDALADVFGGDEINRAQARQFIGMLKRPAKELGTAFLIVAHPSLSGMATGRGTSGSTGWNNSVRSRLYFTRAKASDDSEPDPDLRILSLSKANYGPDGISITLRWKNGVYVPEGGVSSLDRLAQEARAEEVFLRLLQLFEQQGQDVSAKPGPNYAPAQFAAHPDAGSVGKRRLADAMQRLLTQERIRIQTFGPPSRTRSRLTLH